MTNAALKALRRFVHRRKDPEKPIKPREFKVEQSRRRHRRKTDVPVPLNRPFQATEQQVRGVQVHLTHSRAVKHNAWTLDIHADLQCAKEKPAAPLIQFFRQPLYQNSARRKSRRKLARWSV
jgi:hypothetical protein